MGERVVVLAGEYDISRQRELEAQLLGEPGWIVADLSAVTFMDARCAEALRTAGARLEHTPRQVERLLELLESLWRLDARFAAAVA